MGELRSVFLGSSWWRAAVAVMVAAAAAASQESPAPAHVAKRAPVAKPATVDYQREVHAIFAAHCLACHNADKRSGGLSLGAYQDITTGGRTGAAIQPGSSGQSLLVRRILGEVAPQMPLGGDPLTSAEIATLRTWIDEGARATPTSAIAKARWEPPLDLVEPAIPHLTWAGWISPLDRFTFSNSLLTRRLESLALESAVYGSPQPFNRWCTD